MPQRCELVLLVLSEADIASGLSLAERLAGRGGFTARVIVVSDSAASLIEHVKSQIAQRPKESADQFVVASHGADVDSLVEHLDGYSSLRILLVPGLDQWNDNRKNLIRQLHVTVVCFEPHAGLQAEPNRFLLLGTDKRGAATWLCDHWSANAKLIPTTIEQLKASNSAPDQEAVTAGEKSISVSNDVVLFSISPGEIESVRKTSKAAIDAAAGPVVLVRAETNWLQWLTQSYIPNQFAHFVPPMTRETRRQLAEDLSTFSRLDFEFIALICSATFLASFGLIQDSAAVIIGAMLVAPLMTPILGSGLSLSQGNRPLFLSSLRTIAIGFVAALCTSTLFGALLRILPNNFLHHGTHGIELTQEMWSRTSPTIIDFLVGFVGGSAAAFARTRNHLSAALAGAAIAAALVPPIATAGLQLSLLPQPVSTPDGSRLAPHLVYGPMLLFLANMLTIMLGSSFVLWACGVRSERRYTPKDRWATRTMMLLMTLTVIVAVWIVQHP